MIFEADAHYGGLRNARCTLTNPRRDVNHWHQANVFARIVDVTLRVCLSIPLCVAYKKLIFGVRGNAGPGIEAHP